MRAIPDNFIHYKSTDIFDSTNVPKMFLHEHNTRAGVFGKISVLSGSLRFYGFNKRRGDIEQKITLLPGDTAISPPQYWHKVELLTDDTQFIVEFYADKASDIAQQNLSERTTTA